MRVVFLFRRDLRLYDNTAYLQAREDHPTAQILPVYIHAPKPSQLQQSIVIEECLKNLQVQTENALKIYKGPDDFVLTHIFNSTPFQYIYMNRDYTPMGKKRENALQQWCAMKGVELRLFHDQLLLHVSPDPPYQRFTPFYNYALKQSIALPRGSSPTLGRADALEQLAHAKSKNKNYSTTRNTPADPHGTTQLGKYLNTGVLSIREVYHALKQNTAIVRELFFREFYYHLYNHTYEPPAPYSNIPWKKPSSVAFQKWKTGQTGFPFVDAGMRQLKQAHWMHNRLRMVTASFLLKDMMVDWRKGEEWFAENLLDYDPIQNRAGWLWSLGYTDGTPYYRIMSPWAQAKTYDPEAVYIKQWVPELQEVLPKDILRWNEPQIRAKYPHISYPAPMLDHSEATKMFKDLRASWSQS